MKRNSVILLALCLILTTSAFAGIVGSKHDFGSGAPAGGYKGTTTETCAYCHTPHQATHTLKPLWNHTLQTTASYTMYSNGTMNATITAMNAAPTEATATVSHLCLSCHDGSVAVSNMWNAPNGNIQTAAAGTNVTAAGMLTSGPAFVGTDLSNDHPINFVYNGALATADGQLVTPASADLVATGVPLYGGTVQCASCHDAHNSVVGTAFLVKANGASALCLTCHAK